MLGFETDFSGADAKGDTQSVPGAFGCGPGATCHTQLDWYGTVRGGVGWAFDRVLPYVTGGYAYGRLYADLGIPPPTSASGTQSGWTVGAGLEYALPWDHWSVKVEYLYVSLDDLFYDTAQTFGFLSCTAMDNHFSIARADINFRF